MWHVTQDTWHVTGGERLTFSHNFSYLALMVWDWMSSEDIFTKDESLTDLINDDTGSDKSTCSIGFLTISLVFVDLLASYLLFTVNFNTSQYKYFMWEKRLHFS